MMESVSVQGMSADENATANRLLEQLGEKSRRNVLRASYYDGKRAIRQVGSVIPPQYYRMGVVLGWSAKAVDILARRCNLDGFAWPDGDAADLGVDELWRDNQLGSEVSSAMISSLIHGVSFLVNTQDADGRPMIHVKDALSATGEWDAYTRSLKNLISVHERDESGDVTAFTLYLDGVTVTAVKDRGKWSSDRKSHGWGVPAEPLVYKPRVGKPFGTSRISRPVMSLHDQALRTIIRMEGHADIYSFPQMILLGADSSVFKNPDGSVKPAWQIALGRLFALPDDDGAENPRADIKQFQASSPQPHIDQLKQQAQLFSGETSIPLTSLGVSDMSNPTSADSYIASREDLIAEAEGATGDWGPPLRRAVLRGLAMGNGETVVPAEWKSLEARWRSPLYLSRAQQADAGMKQLVAVPWLADTDVGLELLGLSDQQIARAMGEKRRAQGSVVLQDLMARARGPQPAPEPELDDALEAE